MSRFTKIGTKSDFEDGKMKLVEVDDRLVLVFRIGEEFHCIDDICTHDGGTLSDGEFVGCEIKCPRHGARFDVRDGKALCMPATQNTVAHEIKIDNDDVSVQLNES